MHGERMQKNNAWLTGSVGGDFLMRLNIKSDIDGPGSKSIFNESRSDKFPIFFFAKKH